MNVPVIRYSAIFSQRQEVPTQTVIKRKCLAKCREKVEGCFSARLLRKFAGGSSGTSSRSGHKTMRPKNERTSSHGDPACLMEDRGDAPVPPSCPDTWITSALALATPAATVPIPTSDT